MVRYRRDDEAIADALKATRKVAREAARPTGTETALTTQTAISARDDAEQAAIDAAAATETALGFARYTQVDGQEIIPPLPDDGPRPGAELVHVDELGHPYQVDVWNGTAWSRAQYLADQLLVLGEGGTVQIGDGKLSARSIAAETFYGYSFVGAEFVQEASDDLVAFYPVTPGEILEGDWAGGPPDDWGDVSVSTTVKESGDQSIYVTRGVGAGSLSVLWTNNDRVPQLTTSPRGLELRVYATNPVTGVHVTTLDGTQQLEDVPASTWTSLVVDISDETPLEWVHLGVTAPAGTTLYVDVLKVLAMDASGAYMTITRTGAGLPGLFIVDGEGQVIGDVTPLGIRSFDKEGGGFVRLDDGVLTSAATSESGEVEHFVEVGPEGLRTPYGRMARTFSGPTSDRLAYGLSPYVRKNDRYFDEDEDVEYTWLGSAWQVTLPIHGKIAIAPASGGARVVVPVTFPNGSFANIPMVSCNAIANAPTSTSTDLYVQPSSITSSGFDINFMRSTSTTTTIGWTATPDHAGVL